MLASGNSLWSLQLVLALCFCNKMTLMLTLCFCCVFAMRHTFTLCFCNWLGQTLFSYGQTHSGLWWCFARPPSMSMLRCVFVTTTSFVSLWTNTFWPPAILREDFIYFFAMLRQQDHPFSWVDWKWHVPIYALHTIHQPPREFLQQTVSSSCNLARIEGTLQCKDDQNPIYFHSYLVVCGEINKFSGCWTQE